MSYHCFISEHATQEIVSAQKWYDEREDGRGDKFWEAIFRKIELLKQTPMMHALWKKNYRRGKVKDYPYSVYYTVGTKSIEIIAVLHDHQDIDSILKNRS